MNQIMQKQRSPYTGGGFNVQQLKNTNFGKTDGLNGMPFLVQLAKQAQRPMQRLGSSPPPQTFGKLSAGHERGLRSGTPRSYDTADAINNNLSNLNNNNINQNNCYEGDAPVLPSAQTCSHATTDFNHNFQHLEPNALPQMEMEMELQLNAMRRERELPQQTAVHSGNDTDSESEYCQHIKDFSGSCKGRVYWRRAFECLKSRMPPQRQERMEMTLRQCHAQTVLDHVLLLLQLFRILFFGTLGQGLRVGINFGQTSYRLWRCKFQLRGIVRQFLWRMANAKGNDVLLFLGIMLITPWLFLLSLVGFIVATLFHLKTGLGASWRQVRLQILR